MSDFDIKTILAASVAKVTAMLSGFTAEQLNALHDAEEKAEAPRTSLLAAIHKAQQALLPAPPPPPSSLASIIDHEMEAQLRAVGALVIDADAGDLILMLEYHGGAIIVLTDADDVPLVGWPPLEFSADQFEIVPSGAKLNSDIEMGIELPTGAVSAAWLVVGEKPMAVGRLSVPLPAGGGRRAMLPQGSIRFRTDG